MRGRAFVGRARGRQRGAALVEAVVVIPFFLVLFASIVFIGQAYAEKLRVMRESKQKVWTYAMGNCGERGDAPTHAAGDVSGVLRGSEDNGGNGGADLSQAQHASGAPHGDVLHKDVGSAVITVEGAATASGLLGGATAKQSSTRKVMCNEPPYDGSLTGTLKSAWHDITGW